MSGAKHIQFLLDKNLLNIQASPILGQLYSGGKTPFESPTGPNDPKPEGQSGVEETMLLNEAQGKEMATVLEIPELYIELKRAVWQVEKSISTQKELNKEKTDLNSVNQKSNKEE